jgi:hypothetical protein
VGGEEKHPCKMLSQHGFRMLPIYPTSTDYSLIQNRRRLSKSLVILSAKQVNGVVLDLADSSG